MMKNIRLLFITICLFLTACERDFDELKDTDQRSVTFHFSLEKFFSDVLVNFNGNFIYGDNSWLDDGYKIRISMYCYDDKGKLVERSTLFATMDEMPTINIKHLDKKRQYSFIILADVVQFNSEINYFETWYQLKTNQWNQIYLTSLDRKASAIQNVFRRSVFQLYPNNQDVEVQLTTATNNGYVVFENPGNVTKVSGTVLLYQSLYANNLLGISRVYHTYEIPNQNGTISIFPVTATTPDNQIPLKVITHYGFQKDSVVYLIQNSNHKPFVVTVDCQDLTNINCVYY